MSERSASRVRPPTEKKHWLSYYLHFDKNKSMSRVSQRFSSTVDCGCEWEIQQHKIIIIIIIIWNNLRIHFYKLTHSPLIQHVVAWTSFSVLVFFCLSRTRMYHNIQNSWRIMRQVAKDNRCSSLTDESGCAMASISAAPISNKLVPYWPLRISAFFLG